ncbi:MAG TPA: glycine cleavage system protein GcvH [Vicinamibacterales bacterium]|nr:glycine cleavage system protein GcvH [Vicinamibacterales bacterium]
MADPASYRYTKDHEWIDTATGRVGITDYAQQQLGDVVFVDLPEVGTKVSRGQSFGSIESVKAVSELFAPASGEVVEVNASLKDKPEVVNSEPHTTWMIAIKMSTPGDTADLLTAAQYGELVK